MQLRSLDFAAFASRMENPQRYITAIYYDQTMVRSFVPSCGNTIVPSVIMEEEISPTLSNIVHLLVKQSQQSRLTSYDKIFRVLHDRTLYAQQRNTVDYGNTTQEYLLIDDKFGN